MRVTSLCSEGRGGAREEWGQQVAAVVPRGHFPEDKMPKNIPK